MKNLLIKNKIGLILASRGGFTLIELLIVVAVIGILAGAILISTSSSQNKAKANTGKTTMRSAASYMLLCTASGGLITTYNSGNAICSNSTITNVAWPSMPNACTSFTSNTTAGTFIGNCGGTTITCYASNGTCN